MVVVLNGSNSSDRKALCLLVTAVFRHLAILANGLNFIYSLASVAVVAGASVFSIAGSVTVTSIVSVSAGSVSVDAGVWVSEGALGAVVSIGWVFVGSGTVLGAVVSDGWITVASVTSVATEGSVVAADDPVVPLCSVAVVGALVPAGLEGTVCAGGVVPVGVVLFVLLDCGALYFTGLTEIVICSPVKIYSSLFSPVCI